MKSEHSIDNSRSATHAGNIPTMNKQTQKKRDAVSLLVIEWVWVRSPVHCVVCGGKRPFVRVCVCTSLAVARPSHHNSTTDAHTHADGFMFPFTLARD